MSHDINYEWKMAIIKWSELLKDFEKINSYLAKLSDKYSFNKGSDKKAVSDLKKFITLSREWIYAKDKFTRYVIFDLPMTNWSILISNSATGGFFHDKDLLYKEGLKYAYSAPIN